MQIRRNLIVKSLLINKIARAAVMVACVAATSYGATLYSFDIGSGSTINATTGTRSNVDWDNTGGGVAGGGFIYGDPFNTTAFVPGLSAGQQYLVTSISVYAVANLVADNTAALFQSEFSSISLYFGPYADQSSACAAADNCSFPAVNLGAPTITAASYASSANGNACTGYLASDNVTCIPFYKITFAVNLLLQGGTAYEFAADGALNPSLTGCIGGLCGWYNLAATGGPNGNIYGWDGLDLTGGSSVVPTTAPANTDMNVIINGSVVTPEPATWTLSGLGLAGLAFAAIRRRRIRSNLPC
jgi:MYXO-CTERM domain-containing protein